MTAAVLPSTASLERLHARAAAERHGWPYYVAWAAALALLVWAWRGAEMRPFDLMRDAGNISTYASDFFPPDFRDWRIYVREMIVTVHIALWGTLLAVIAAVPMGLLCATNVSPVWIHQPARRLMDACRAINEMVFAMLFIVAVGLGPFAGVLVLLRRRHVRPVVQGRGHHDAVDARTSAVVRGADRVRRVRVVVAVPVPDLLRGHRVGGADRVGRRPSVE